MKNNQRLLLLQHGYFVEFLKTEESGLAISKENS